MAYMASGMMPAARCPYLPIVGWLRDPAPVDSVDRWFIPLFIGFQHVSTILLVVQEGPAVYVGSFLG